MGKIVTRLEKEMMKGVALSNYLYEEKKLKEFRTGALKLIEENPFFRTRWHWLDKQIYKIMGLKLPLTDKQLRRRAVNALYKRDLMFLYENYLEKCNEIDKIKTTKMIRLSNGKFTPDNI